MRAVAGAVLALSVAAGVIGVVFGGRVLRALMRRYWTSEIYVLDPTRRLPELPVRRRDVQLLVGGLSVAVAGTALAAVLISSA